MTAEAPPSTRPAGISPPWDVSRVGGHEEPFTMKTPTDLINDQAFGHSHAPTPTPAPREFVGYRVIAVDGRVGWIDHSSWQVGDAAMVVNTGRWFGKRRVVPARAVTKISHAGQEIYVDLRKADVKAAPEWEPWWPGDDWGGHAGARSAGEHDRLFRR
jgi:hypothetical protein